MKTLQSDLQGALERFWTDMVQAGCRNRREKIDRFLRFSAGLQSRAY